MGVVRDTLVACCTPRGAGALSLIRIAGPDARHIACAIGRSHSSSALSSAASHTVVYGSIVDAHTVLIDTVLFIFMDGPRTFTGDNTVEITCHNNDLIIEKIIDAAIAAGARLAGPGEFTRRAVENGKLDMIQAEAIHELITAQNEWALKQSHAQLRGTLSNEMYLLENELVSVMAWSEASFDFLDEGGGFALEIDARLTALHEKINALLAHEARMGRMRSGMRVALIGIVNAGKSSLFNALLGTNRAIVSPHPGTTRDTIEAEIIESGVRWTLIDTAGLRSTDDQIEQAGIERTHEEAARADIIILAEPSDHILSNEEQELYTKIITQHSNRVLHIATKSDTHSALRNNLLAVSSATGHNIAILREHIIKKGQHLINEAQAPFLLTQRHIRSLQTAATSLRAAQKFLAPVPHYELVSYHLQQALEEISGMTGKSITEAAMDRVFKEFCVGK